jgi:hypothetical protein
MDANRPTVPEPRAKNPEAILLKFVITAKMPIQFDKLPSIRRNPENTLCTIPEKEIDPPTGR